MKKVVISFLLICVMVMLSFVFISSNQKAKAVTVNYAGIGNQLKYTPTGEDYKIVGNSVIIPVYKPCYKKNTSFQWSLARWSDWSIYNNKSNVSIYYYRGDTYPEYKVESKYFTRYISNKGEISEYRTSKPLTWYKNWKVYDTKLFYRYKTLNMTWDTNGYKSTETVSLNYSLFDRNGSPIKLGIHAQLASQSPDNIPCSKGYTSYQQRDWWYFTINNNLAEIAVLVNKYLQKAPSTGIDYVLETIGDKLTEWFGAATVLTAMDKLIMNSVGKKAFSDVASDALEKVLEGNLKLTKSGGYGISYLGMVAIALEIAKWGADNKSNRDIIEYQNLLYLLTQVSEKELIPATTIIKVSTNYFWLKQNDCYTDYMSYFTAEIVDDINYVSMYNEDWNSFVSIEYITDLSGFDENLQDIQKYDYKFSLGF